ncbi:MAG: phytanoyl-CoA hydroxylase [Rhodothermales bacterium]|jgi:phytanoyl-CoA hydroxylase
MSRFERDGYLALPQFVAGAEFAELQGQVERFIAEVLPGLAPEYVFYEDRDDLTTLKQIQQMGDHDPWFHDLFTTGRFRELAEELLNGPVVPRNMQYFNKPPGIGKPTPPHQDGYYFMLEPCEAVTMWFALDPADVENGCVHYVRSSHLDGMRPHGRTETLGFSQGITDYPQQSDVGRELPMLAQPGDLMVHHALTIHRAGANPSPRHRRALGFIYYSERAREDVAAHQAYQEKLARDMQATGKLAT